MITEMMILKMMTTTLIILQSVSECEEGEKLANGNLQLPIVSKSNGEVYYNYPEIWGHIQCFAIENQFETYIS